MSGPARSAPAPARARTTAAPRTARRPAPAAARGDLALLDRLVRGRLWIVLLATALVGLVFLQISLLKLNSGIGRAVQTSATLERQNAVLRAEVSRLGDGERIQGAAAGYGMVMPGPGDRRYLQVGSGDAARAARNITKPSPVVQQPLPPGLAPTPGPVSPEATAPAAPTQQAATPAAPAATAAAPASGTPTAQTASPAQTAPAQTAPAQTAQPAAGAATGGASPDPAAG